MSEIKLKASGILLAPFIRIVTERAIKSTEHDSFNDGCDPSTRREKQVAASASYGSILEAFQDIVGVMNIKPDQIQTFDPNTYRDAPKGGAITIDDNKKLGLFRCLYDRLETIRGNAVNSAGMKRFEGGEIMRHATYELFFHIRIVNVPELPLADFLGVKNYQ